MFYQKRYSTILTSTFFLFFTLFSNLTSAQSIFDNPITGVDPSDFNPYTTGQHVHSNITVSGFKRSSGIKNCQGNNRYNAEQWCNLDTIDLNDYFYFILTPNPGYKINFSSFAYTGQASGGGPDRFAFRSSVDGYSTNIGAPDEHGTIIPLTAASFQNITSPITFRFYGWNANNASGKFSINDFTFNAAEVLPIELSSFGGQVESNMANLDWVTATENNNDYFSIERSAEGSDFDEIGRVGGAGTSYEPQAYSFSDEHPQQGKNYYRLRQVDYDEKFNYSPIVMLTFGKLHQMVLAPRPASDNLHILLEKPTQEDAFWQVFDLSGGLILSGELLAETTECSFSIAELPKGNYVLRLSIGQDVMVEQFGKN